MTPISSRALLRLAGPLVALACLAGGPAAAQSNYPCLLYTSDAADE